LRDAWNNDIADNDILRIEQKYNKVHRLHEKILTNFVNNIRIPLRTQHNSQQPRYRVFPVIRLRNQKYYSVVPLYDYIMSYMNANNNNLPQCPIGDIEENYNSGIYVNS
jgi:hypothetical protein